MFVDSYIPTYDWKPFVFNILACVNSQFECFSPIIFKNFIFN